MTGLILENRKIYSKTLLDTWKIWGEEGTEPSLYKPMREKESLQFTRKETETKELSKTTQPADPAYSELSLCSFLDLILPSSEPINLKIMFKKVIYGIAICTKMISHTQYLKVFLTDLSLPKREF